MKLIKRFLKEQLKQYHKEVMAITINKVVIIVKQQVRNNKIRVILKNDNTLKIENFE